MVDITALIFSVVFYYGAQKTKKRAYHGEQNSIWALPLDSIEVAAKQKY